MQHDDKTVADMAAGRLKITLQMLETEVKQTPGIKRSIEIIRSHLGPQWSSETQIPHSTLSEGAEWSDHVQDATIESAQRALDTPVSTAEEQHMYNRTDNNTRTDPLESGLWEGMQGMMHPELQMDPASLGWSLDDFGGGFVPDMAYWSPFGQPYQ